MMIAIVVALIVVGQACAEQTYYRAAVLEHVRFQDLSFPLEERTRRNLNQYKLAADTAATDGADIIVFPEWGLNIEHTKDRNVLARFGDHVPDPKLHAHNPCVETELFFDRPILTFLSCLAMNNSIFLVANMLDHKTCRVCTPCSSNDTEACSIDCDVDCYDGSYLYNTNVVFDRDGRLVSRYYKRHLYFEASMNEPSEYHDAYFQTDFGNFTTFICFDMVFKDSVDAVERGKVLNVAYPTYWYDFTPPVFFSVPIQQAWAMTNRVNFLASGVHRPETGTLGSGIYSGTLGALVYSVNPDGQSKLLVSNVPLIPGDDDGFVADAKRYILAEGKAAEEEEDHQTAWSAIVHDQCHESVLGPGSGPNDYRCHDSNIIGMSFLKLTNLEDTVNLCSGDFCCSLRYLADSMDEDFFFGVMGYPLEFFEKYKYGAELCILARCDGTDSVCSNYAVRSHTVFRSVELSGNFSASYVYPYAINSNLRLTNKSDWSQPTSGVISYHNSDNSSLVFLGLYGRRYDLDALMEHG